MYPPWRSLRRCVKAPSPSVEVSCRQAVTVLCGPRAAGCEHHPAVFHHATPAAPSSPTRGGMGRSANGGPLTEPRVVETQPGIPCPSCHQGNRPGRRFCADCGARLDVTCASCGAANEPGEKFCGACGTALTRLGGSPTGYVPKHLADKILTSRAALEGERKQVTV